MNWWVAVHQEKFRSGDILVFGVFNIEKHKTSLVYPKKETISFVKAIKSRRMTVAALNMYFCIGIMFN